MCTANSFLLALLFGCTVAAQGKIISGEELCDALERMTNAYIDKYTHEKSGGLGKEQVPATVFNTKKLTQVGGWTGGCFTHIPRVCAWATVALFAYAENHSPSLADAPMIRDEVRMLSCDSRSLSASCWETCNLVLRRIQVLASVSDIAQFMCQS